MDNMITEMDVFAALKLGMSSNNHRVIHEVKRLADYLESQYSLDVQKGVFALPSNIAYREFMEKLHYSGFQVNTQVSQLVVHILTLQYGSYKDYKRKQISLEPRSSDEERILTAIQIGYAATSTSIKNEYKTLLFRLTYDYKISNILLDDAKRILAARDKAVIELANVGAKNDKTLMDIVDAILQHESTEQEVLNSIITGLGGENTTIDMGDEESIAVKEIQLKNNLDLWLKYMTKENFNQYILITSKAAISSVRSDSEDIVVESGSISLSVPQPIPFEDPINPITPNNLQKPISISADQAFERIGASVRSSLTESEKNSAQARLQSGQFFKYTLGFAIAGFIVVP